VKTSVFQKIIDVIQSISFATGVDLSLYRTEFSSKVFDLLESGKADYEFCEAIALSIMFRDRVFTSFRLERLAGVLPDPSSHSNHALPSFSHLAEIYADMKLDDENPVLPSFSLLYDDCGNWIERELARRVLVVMNARRQRSKGDIPQSMVVLLYQFFQPFADQDYEADLIPILEGLLSELDKSDEFYSLLISFIARLPQSSILESLTSRIAHLGEQTIVNAFNALNNYCDQPPASLPHVVSELVVTFSAIQIQSRTLPSAHSPDVRRNLTRQDEQITSRSAERRTTAGRYWRMLWQQLAYSGSPFFSHALETPNLHFKRFGMVDHFMRPKILKTNADFDLHKEASANRDNQDHEMIHSRSMILPRLPSHFIFPRIDSLEAIAEGSVEVNRYVWRSPAQLIKINQMIEGTFTATSTAFTFVGADVVISIPADTIEGVFFQYVLQRPTAIEMVTLSHRTYLFNFPNVQSHRFVHYFRSIPMPRAMFIQSMPGQAEVLRLVLQKQWLNREISTFEYLMYLNLFSGRSLNNLHAYPIFPWVLVDYTSPTLDLTNPKSFRDLSKPVGALNPSRLAKLKELRDNSMDEQKFLYQSSYSSQFVVLHFMVRLEPFTTAHIEFQDGRFDVASRMFTSIGQAFERALCSPANFRELIPEFFYCPEFLSNNDGFDLGTLPDGRRVNHVELPAWASSPEDFVYKHLMALESDYVSEHLNEWIDLIWGYKQRGEEADRADNTFDPRFYSEVWSVPAADHDVKIIEEMLLNVGSIPLRLFDQPHPKRNPRSTRSTFEYTRVSISTSPIVDIKAVGGPFEKLRVFTLSADGRVFVVRPDRSVSAISRAVFNGATATSAGTDPHMHFAFAIPDSSDLCLVQSNGTVVRGRSSEHIDAITCSCFIGSEIVTGGRDSLLAKWRLNEKRALESVASLMVHSDVVSCILGSNFYGIVISCSVDRRMVISIASDFSFVRSINLDIDRSYVPASITIARSVGRILVCSASVHRADPGNLVSVYTLNGGLIKHCFLPETITAWCTITTSDGFDFIGVADQTGTVSLFDAYDMALVRVVYRGDARVTTLKYQRQSDAFIIGTAAGELIMGNLFR
jgi:hypothetical protein